MEGSAAQTQATQGQYLAHPLGFGELAAGVVLPAVCLILDPMALRAPPQSVMGPDPMYPHLLAAGWLFVGLEGLALLLYGLVPIRAPAWHATFAGLLLVGAVVALIAGLVLLPMALPAVVVGIGLLGLVPFFTCFVFLRRATRALRRSRAWRHLGLAACLLLGMAFTVGAPAATWAIGRHEMRTAIDRLQRGGPNAVKVSVERLGRVRWLVYMDDLVAAWKSNGDEEARQRMADTYRAVTGTAIKERQDQRERSLD